MEEALSFFSVVFFRSVAPPLFLPPLPHSVKQKHIRLYKVLVHIYLKYHSVCHLVRNGTPLTPASECVPPHRNQKGGQTHLRLRGSQFGRLEKGKEETQSLAGEGRVLILTIGERGETHSLAG